MNKLAKALLLTLVFSAPVAISVPAVQAKPTTTATNGAKPSNRSHRTKKHPVTHRSVKSTAGVKPVSVNK